MNPNPKPAGQLTGPEPHPDAESLNAFAERALTERERSRVLAHLAICGRCRQVVALAQEASAPEGPAEAVAASARPTLPWFRNWRIAWVPVAALTCMATLAVMVHVRRVERMGEEARTEAVRSAPPQLAAQQQALAAPPSPQAAIRAVPSPSHHPAILPSAKKLPVPRHRNEPPSPQTVAEAAFSSQPGIVSAQGLEGRPPAPPAAAKAESKQAPALFSTEAAAWRQQEQPLSAGQKASIPENERQVWRNAAAPAASGSNFALQSEGAGGGLGGALRPEAGTRFAALPSGLVTVSAAMTGRRVVGVDSGGSVFLSEDGGTHWQPVSRQWTGKAEAVRAQPAAGGAASSAGIARSSVFVLKNDSGGEWTSSDGRTWTAK